MNKINKLLKPVDNVLSKLLGNKFVSLFLKIFLVFYTSLMVPKLPEKVLSVLNHTVSRIIIAAIIVILATKDVTLGILSAVAFIMTIEFSSYLNLFSKAKEVKEHFEIITLDLDNEKQVEAIKKMIEAKEVLKKITTNSGNEDNTMTLSSTSSTVSSDTTITDTPSTNNDLSNEQLNKLINNISATQTTMSPMMGGDTQTTMNSMVGGDTQTTMNSMVGGDTQTTTRPMVGGDTQTPSLLQENFQNQTFGNINRALQSGIITKEEAEQLKKVEHFRSYQKSKKKPINPYVGNQYKEF